MTPVATPPRPRPASPSFPIPDDMVMLTALEEGAMGFNRSGQKEGDCGLDLYVSQTTVIEPGTMRNVPTGVRVLLPGNEWGLMVGRSSTIRKRGLLIIPGIIDTGYRGLLYSAAWNLSPRTVTVKRGERIAQLIPLPNLTPLLKLQPVGKEEMVESERGEKGFGSTGR